MFTRLTPSALRSVLSLLSLVALTSACQPKPGEYRVYRIASLPSQDQPDCTNNEVDPNVAEDSTTFFGTQSIAVFASDKDTYFLEFAGDSLTGTRDGKEYLFAGESVDVTVMGELSITASVDLDVALTIDNREITGEFVRVVRSTCNGAGCDAVPDFTCTTLGTFFGSEIKDAELEYPVGGGGEL